MGKYDQYARTVMRSAMGTDWVEDDHSIYSFGDGGGYGQVDGTIAGHVAVEFGIGSPKQIRASILDLVLHPYEAKLLVLVDTPGHSTEASVVQAGRILRALGCPGVVIRISTDSQSDRKDQINDTIRKLTTSFAPETNENVVRLLDTVGDTSTTIPR